MCGFFFCFISECRDVLLPMMLRELSGALASMADGPHDERRNSLELLNNILEVLSRDNVVRHTAKNIRCHVYTCIRLHSGCLFSKLTCGQIERIYRRSNYLGHICMW